MHTCTRIYTLTCTHRGVDAVMNGSAYIHIHTDTYTYTHIYIHSHAHTEG